MKGVIVRMVPGKGFGFARDPEGLSRFFNASAVDPIGDFDRMREGDPVEFEPVEGTGKGNGLAAAAVRLTARPGMDQERTPL